MSGGSARAGVEHRGCCAVDAADLSACLLALGLRGAECTGIQLSVACRGDWTVEDALVYIKWSQQGQLTFPAKGWTVHISGLTGCTVSVIMALPAAVEGNEPGTG